MFARAENPVYASMVALIVALIMVGAFALTGAAILENIRFARATNNILILVARTRQIAASQPTFAATAGVDVVNSLIGMEQITSAANSTPWGGVISLTTLSSNLMRYEAVMPTRDCRRIALYLLARHPSELGLLAIEAQDPQKAANATVWNHIYPVTSPDSKTTSPDLVVPACGKSSLTKLGMVFRYR